MLKGGRLGNQILRFCHLLAWIKANGDFARLINVNFWQYATLFSCWESNRFCSYPIPVSPNWINRQVYHVFSGQRFYPSNSSNAVDTTANNSKHARLRLLHHQIHRLASLVPGVNSITSEKLIRGHDKVTHIIDLENVAVFDQVLSSRITLLGGWRLQAWNDFYSNRVLLRNYFRGASIYREIAVAHVKSTRKPGGILVGVLIRQDDYRRWGKGKYFFESNEYAKYMLAVSDIFSTQHCSFLIVSDERQDERAFPKLDTAFGTGHATGSGHYIENMLELSLCDLILSPPSTFSAVAAYLGDTPILPITGDIDDLVESNILQENIFDAKDHLHFSESVK